MGRVGQRYTVDPRCYSVKFNDGSEYPVVDGRLAIDRPEHIDEMRSSAQIKDGWIHEAKHIFIDADGKFCSTCAFHAFIWSSRCPRCGGIEFAKEDA